MMKQGKDGQLCLYYNNLLIAGYPLGNMTLKDYADVANRLLLDSLRKQNRNLREQSFAYKYFCKEIYMRKLMKKKIHDDDYRLFLGAMLSLVKLKQFDIEDISMVFPRKKKSTSVRPS